MGSTIRAKQKMELTEQQALMSDNMPHLLKRAPLRVNQMDFGQHGMGTTTDGEFSMDMGNGFITIMKSESNGTLKHGHRVPKDIWA